MVYYNLEDVYKTTGVPSVTFVQPQEYLSLVVSLRSIGKCVVVEGPSGIGKTTAILKAIEQLGKKDEYQMFSARKAIDRSSINQIAKGEFEGTVIIDDFHRLDSSTKESISNVMKYIADESDEQKKIIVVGINKVGDSLIHFSPDLNNRIATIRFEANPDSKVEALINNGEQALNIHFDNTRSIIENARGSFHIAQLMCQKACIQQGIINTCNNQTTVHFSYPKVMAEMFEELSRSFFDIARQFATGNRLRRAGRAPYLHILKWLSESPNWSVNLTTAMQQHPRQKPGVVQVVEKGYLKDFIEKHPNISDYIHFDSDARILSVEDPKLIFYLKSINWNNFARDIGYIDLVEEPRYDFALSFAGQERSIVEKVFSRLTALEIAVFYDFNEQVDILSVDVEEYLYPIYNSEAIYVVPFMSKNYPNRVWTKFESRAFKERFGNNAVIPIWFDDVDDSMFDMSKEYGGITYCVKNNIDDEVDKIVSLLAEKIQQYRSTNQSK